MTDFCRLCSAEKFFFEMVEIKDVVILDLSIYEICSSLNINLISSKLMPQNMCSECITAITNFLNFVNHANNVQKTFQKKFVQLKECTQLKSDLPEIPEPETILKVELVDNDPQDFSSDAETEYNDLDDGNSNDDDSEQLDDASTEEDKRKKKRNSRAKSSNSSATKKRKQRSDYGKKKLPTFFDAVEEVFADELGGNFAAPQVFLCDSEHISSNGKVSEAGLLLVDPVRWVDVVSHACKLCQKVFPDLIQLERHFDRAHLKHTTEKFACLKCKNHSFKYTHQIANHAIQHHFGHLKFCCILCSEMHSSLIHLYKHMKKEHFEIMSHFGSICLYCGEHNYKKRGLKHHQIRHTKQRSNTSNQSTLPALLEPDWNTTDLLIYDSEKNEDGTLDDQVVARLELKRWSDVRMNCSSCPLAENMTVLELHSHFNSHHKEEKDKTKLIYPCECFIAKTHGKIWSIFNHQITTHNKGLAHSCPVCSQVFWNYISLDRHLKTGHLQDKMTFYICLTCGQYMRNQEHMLYHMTTIHEIQGLQKNICDQCGKVMASSSRLKFHVQQVHDQEATVYECDVCKATFKCKYRLKYHKKNLHTLHNRAFACSICGAAFKINAALKAHYATHFPSVEKQFACSFCDKKFLRKADCKVHERLHTGDYPYHCPIEGCTDRYPSWSNLYKHCKSRHKISIVSQKTKMYRQMGKELEQQDDVKMFAGAGDESQSRSSGMEI